MARLIEAGMQMWQASVPATSGDPDEIRQRYESGLVGAWKDPDAKEQLRSCVESLGYETSFSAVAHRYGYADSYAGKLVLPFRFAEFVFPGVFPGAAQQVGDCVSHSTKNASLITFCSDICLAQPDEQTGAVEVTPLVPDQGIREGAFSSESIYWWRGYNGHGWSCDTAAQMIMKHGLLLRKPYPTLNLDLTNYSGRQASLYGSRAPADAIHTESFLHCIRTVAEANVGEELRDALGTGFGISSCGSQGYSSTRDANGVSKQSGRWAHAMAVIGYDDRASTKTIYSEPLVLVMNSWGTWNSGPRRIRGTQIDIPVGSFWTPLSHFINRSFHVLSGAKGWQRDKLPDFHLGVAL